MGRIIWTSCFRLLLKDQQLTLTADVITSFSRIRQLSFSHQCSLSAMDHHRWRYMMLLRWQATSMVRCRRSLVQNSRSEPTNHTKTPNCFFLLFLMISSLPSYLFSNSFQWKELQTRLPFRNVRFSKFSVQLFRLGPTLGASIVRILFRAQRSEEK